MGRISFIAWLLAAALTVQASVLDLQTPRLTVLSGDASELRSEELSVSKPLKTPVTLGPTDTLKLTFTVATDDGKAVQPHQTFLRFYDEVSGEEGVQPVRVSSSGKGKFELNMAKPPIYIPPTTSTDPLKVTLLLGSFTHDPAKIELFDLYLPESHPPSVHPDEASFHPLPPIEHTFNPDPKTPPRVISLVFSFVVLAPWVILLGLLSQVNFRLTYLGSVSPFIALLTAFEGLLLWYWVSLRLGQVLLYGAGLGLVTFAAGNRALRGVAERRITGR